MTRNEELIFSALQQLKKPLGAYCLLEHLRKEGLRSPLQIYRALDKLQSYGLVHRLESLNAFIACTHPAISAPCSSKEAKIPTHEVNFFMICQTCFSVDELYDESIDAFLHARSREQGFYPKKTNIEIHGDCRACQGQ